MTEQPSRIGRIRKMVAAGAAFAALGGIAGCGTRNEASTNNPTSTPRPGISTVEISGNCEKNPIDIREFPNDTTLELYRCTGKINGTGAEIPVRRVLLEKHKTHREYIVGNAVSPDGTSLPNIESDGYIKDSSNGTCEYLIYKTEGDKIIKAELTPAPCPDATPTKSLHA